jgi:hypothetical protein
VVAKPDDKWGERVEAADKRAVMMYRASIGPQKRAGSLFGEFQEGTFFNGKTFNEPSCRHAETTRKLRCLVWVYLYFFVFAAFPAAVTGKAERLIPEKPRLSYRNGHGQDW